MSLETVKHNRCLKEQIGMRETEEIQSEATKLLRTAHTEF